ncbi:MAG: nicotinate-nucleotide diphosphorylase (carboxylating) [Desulfobacteraceae bacterium IS3]|nr:MAG: nicotinate-nucleotide diphosphorylase (carboxylating) [Desulfobacteraceae bacterium IS3]
MYSVQHIVETALREDIGPGDITTNNLVGPDRRGKGEIIAKESLLLAGLDVAKQVFTCLDPKIHFYSRYKDGNTLKDGDVALRIEGRLRDLLAGERTALNFLQHLSGIATHVRSYCDMLEGRNVRLVDTRKTTPGWLILEKYAVRVGGAYNHRMGLYDGVLVKENHIMICGGVKKAIECIRKNVSHLTKIEVEVSDMDGVKEAIDAGAEVVMLSGMNAQQIKAAVEFIAGRAVIEASGRIKKENLISLADSGVDIISMGELTQTARWVDMTMRVSA